MFKISRARKLSLNCENQMIFVFMFLLLFTLVTYSHEGQLKSGYDGRAQAEPSNVKPKELEGVGIEEKPGQQLDLNLVFKNEKGEDVKLGSFYDGKHPVVISLVYYSCPGLCNFHLNGVVEGLKGLDWNPGDKFHMVAISFDAKETPELAAAKKKNYMALYEREGTERGFHFLTADQKTIDQITESIGFKYKWNETAKEWSHASAAVFTTPKGTISRYLGGITFEPKSLKLALNEATDGKIGTIIDSVVLMCFHLNNEVKAASLTSFRLVQMGGIAIMVILMFWLIPFWIRNRKSEGTTGR